MGNKKDVTGEKYHMLTITGDAPSKRQPSGKIDRRVYTECECGNSSENSYKLLKQGRIKSCGCLNENAKTKVNIGDTFNHWTLVEEIKPFVEKRRYLCRCVCGKEEIRELGRVFRGETKSCGCMRDYSKPRKPSKVCPKNEIPIRPLNIDKINNSNTKTLWKIIEEISAERNEKQEIERTVRVQCKCGYEKTVKLENTRDSKQCSKCANEEIKAQISEEDRLLMKRLIGIYTNMKSRCNNPNCKSYPDYGAKGIRVEESFDGFRKFYNWALNNGYKIDSGLEIDRRDGTKGYSEDNCRFVSKSENVLNCKHINLTPDDVLWIRSEYYSMEEALKKFTCSKNVILNIRNFKTFKDII